MQNFNQFLWGKQFKDSVTDRLQQFGNFCGIFPGAEYQNTFKYRMYTSYDNLK